VCVCVCVRARARACVRASSYWNIYAGDLWLSHWTL
jgi:hypothetical protein